MKAVILFYVAHGVLRGSAEPAWDLGDSLSEDLWDGVDVDDPEMVLDTNSTANSTEPEISHMRVNASHETNASYRPQCSVLGMFNTGTNLMNKMLTLNFPGKVWQKDMFPWKHSLPSKLANRKLYLGTPGNYVAIAMIRNPMSWFSSLKKAPYDLAHCVRRPNWITGACTMGPGQQTYVSREMTVAHPYGVHFNNLGGVWNSYTKEYGELTRLGLKATVLVRYEDLVLNTRDVLDRIATAIDAPRPAVVKQLTSSAKSHGRSSGRQAAIQKLKTKSYLHDLTLADRTQICNVIDATIARKMQYSDCNSWT